MSIPPPQSPILETHVRLARRMLPLLLLVMAGCATPSIDRQGRIDVFDPVLAGVVDPNARIERLAEGFTWSEGPAWMGGIDGALLFTDVPENRMHRWSPRDGLSVFLQPSGYAGPPTAALREPGANGLLAEPGGTLLLADSGSRLVARLDLASKRKTVLADRFDGHRFNSPNDLAKRADGRIFFTDPPYGLVGIQDSPARELPFSGVYRLDVDGSVSLLDESLAFPNGIALSPDGRTLYVSNSDPKKPVWIAYSLDDDGKVLSRRVFADAADLVATGAPGLPDGMAVATDGTLFASAPGGVLVFAPDGRRLGRIETGGPVSNVAFGGDGRDLYMTSGSILARVRVRASGLLQAN